MSDGIISQDLQDRAETAAKSEGTLRSEAYSEATSTLRETYRSAFNTLYKAACEARGIVFTPRLTEEEKAQQTIEDLLEKYPKLRERLVTPEGRKPGFLS